MKKIAGIYGLIVFVLFLLLPQIGEGANVTVTCPKQKLQTAITKAAADTTILVKGTCNENVVIDETKINITLNGNGTATIHGTNIAPSSETVWVKGRGIVISGLYVTGGWDGIRVDNGGTATIESSTIELTNNNGVQIGTFGYAIILDNTIQDNPNNGIEVHDNAAAHIGFVFYTDTVAQPNTIQNNGNHGIDIQRSSSASVVGNTIQDNINNGIRVAGDSHADISDNVINNNGMNGIRVEDNSGVNLGNTTGGTIFDDQNNTTVNNGNYGISCTIGGYVDGLLGTLNGDTAATIFSKGCFDNL